MFISLESGNRSTARLKWFVSFFFCMTGCKKTKERPWKLSATNLKEIVESEFD